MEAFAFYINSKLEEMRFGTSPEPKPLMLTELKTWPFWRAVLAEFIGTMLFVFLGCASAMALGGVGDTVHISFAFGLSIMLLIQMFGHVSGGHFNPSVSLGMAVALIITPIRALMYLIAQTCGAIIGALILKGVTPTDKHANLGVTKLNSSLNAGQGVGMEIILTFCLVYTIIATTDSNRHDYGSVSLKIGLTVASLHLSGITFTGSSMNPSRSLGSAVASEFYEYHWIYWVGPLIGGALAGIMYKYLFSPYRGKMSTDDAVQRMLADGNLVTIPRDYFNNDANKATGEVKLESMKM